MNAKALAREWKHSVLQCILLLTVATFIDDSLRVVLGGLRPPPGSARRGKLYRTPPG